MNKQIALSSSSRAELIETFKVSQKALSQALNYHTNSPLAKTLRAAARERRRIEDGASGCEAREFFVTSFEESTRRMVQVLSARVRVVCELEGDGGTKIEVDGVEVKNFGEVPLKKLPVIRGEAQAIVDGMNK